MSLYVRLIPIILLVALMSVLRLGLMRRSRPRRKARLQIAGMPILMLLPLVMIGVAALSGAFSALGTPLGSALAPVMFAPALDLAFSIRPRTARQVRTAHPGPASPRTGSSSA